MCDTAAVARAHLVIFPAVCVLEACGLLDTYSSWVFHFQAFISGTFHIALGGETVIIVSALVQWRETTCGFHFRHISIVGDAVRIREGHIPVGPVLVYRVLLAGCTWAKAHPVTNQASSVVETGMAMDIRARCFLLGILSSVLKIPVFVV